MGKYESDASRRKLAREIAGDAMVLLENRDKILPLCSGQKVAVFGRTQNDIIIGGGGSGASHSDSVLPLMSELKNAGLIVNSELEKFYIESYEHELANRDTSNDIDFSKLEGLVSSGLIYELFGKYNGIKSEPLPGEVLVSDAAKETDVAIYILGRATGGEECDRRLESDYYLDESEIKLVSLINDHFRNIIVIYNINGLVDMSWMEKYPNIKAALFMGTLGEQAAGALADILTGVTTPSGKLSQTVALSYNDYPSSTHFSFNKDNPESIKTYEDYGLDATANGSKGFDISPVTVYAEDIFVGYRYFDTFNKPVLYPFGFGLSYADFDVKCDGVSLENGNLKIKASVTNTSSNYSGREVVEAYISKPDSGVKRSRIEFKAFAKTGLLKPGESEAVTLSFEASDLAYFDEKEMAFIIEQGIYELLIGTSSADTEKVANITVADSFPVKRVKADIGFSKANEGKVKLLETSTHAHALKAASKYEIVITSQDIPVTETRAAEYSFEADAATSTLKDVVSGKVTMEEFVNQMSAEELAVLCNGYGPGLPFGGIGLSLPSTIKDSAGNDIAYNSHESAANGYVNPAIEKYGIPSCFYKDGPASVGKTAWPTGMMLSCTFDRDLLYEFGRACGEEAVSLKVSSWLAPGMNIIRNPIEGRAFEYFSEDPYLCGVCGTSIALGAMENNNITVCPKHFALNEQETYRRGNLKKKIDAVDSIVSARAAREIYLKPFEMIITKAKPTTIMTSFNKINGVFAAGNYALNTLILREEWGYDGVVVTDWGDMDIVVDGADAVAAGNDVIMPGGPPVIKQVLKGLEEGRVSIYDMRVSVAHLMNFVKNQL